MLGSTHITLGVASALIVTCPKSVSEVISTVAAGAFGGWIVDIDCRNKKNSDLDMEEKRESIYNLIIQAFFIGAFLFLDYLFGDGVCQYIRDNWGARVWLPLLCFLIFLLIGYNTKHRTFTHSFVGMAIFCFFVYFFCRPAALPFMIGYVSHIISDFFNMRGLQLFFPLRWRFCLRLCPSNKKANKVLFWVSLILSVVVGAFLFSSALISANDMISTSVLSTKRKILGLNTFQLYLVFVNAITFLGFQKSWQYAYREQLAESDNSVRIKLEFETWILNFLVFIGGGFGMFLCFLLHLRWVYPRALNGNWWAFCYASVLTWIVIYCCICNPFNLSMHEIMWLSRQHIQPVIYICLINILNGLYIFSIRKKVFDENSIKHLPIILMGMLGGTIGAIITIARTHRQQKYRYVTMGFPVMLISQIIFIIYSMSVGIL